MTFTSIGFYDIVPLHPGGIKACACVCVCVCVLSESLAVIGVTCRDLPLFAIMDNFQ